MTKQQRLALIYRRIQSYVAFAGTSDRDVSIKATGKSDAARNIRDGREPGAARLAAIARVMDVPVDLLASENPDMLMPWEVEYTQAEPAHPGLPGEPYSAPPQVPGLAGGPDDGELFREFAAELVKVYRLERVAIEAEELAYLAWTEFAEVLAAGDTADQRRGAIRLLARQTRRNLRKRRAGGLRDTGTDD